MHPTRSLFPVVVALAWAAGSACEVEPVAVDACPDDPAKEEPGPCGCGVAEDDEDADGLPDCVDSCPELPDDGSDADLDGIADACDLCPSADPPLLAELYGACTERLRDCSTPVALPGCGGPVDCATDWTPIWEALRENPPTGGDAESRRDAIEALDAVLLGTCAKATGGGDFFAQSMQQVVDELDEPVTSGAVVWNLYNHGFLVKTPELTFAFDLVGYRYWTFPLVELSDRIDVVFVSHEHIDHYARLLAQRVMARGGHAVVPSENASFGDIPMAAGETLSIGGLSVTAYSGEHSVPVRMYEVVTPGGLRFFHTGDNSASENLPENHDIDVLLLNAWVNEYGTLSAQEGMRACLRRTQPRLMLPGHIQELDHAYVPSDPATRIPYAWPLEVMDSETEGEVHVLTWGERLIIPE